MKPFWRETDLSESEAELLQLCMDAHAKSALRNNISTATVAQIALGSGDYTKAMIAALCSLGGLHAPLFQTWQVLANEELKLCEWIAQDRKIPGWGNSFEKGHEDPVWSEVQHSLERNFTKLAQRIAEITGLLHAAGKRVFPNPSCYTAATALALRIPPQVMPWIFIQGRLASWALIFCSQLGITNLERKGI